MTLGTVAVGFDGSTGSTRALHWAQALSDGCGAKVTAISAFANPPSELTPEIHQRMLDEYQSRLRERWLPPSVDLAVRDGDPRHVLTSPESRSDLLVVGRAGHGSEPGPGHIGSVVEHIAHHIRWPLVVVAGNGPEPAGPLVLGLDGSAQSAAATGVCADLARSFGVPVVAVVVRLPLSGEDPSHPQATHESVLAELDGWAAPLQAVGVDVEAVVEVDRDPAAALLRVAERRHAAAIIIGTRGVGGFTGLRFGGVAMRALHRSKHTLVLVPPVDDRR